MPGTTMALPAPSAMPTLSELLKAETAEHHRHAERRQLQRDLAAGRLAPDAYAAWLGQMLLLHRALALAVQGAVPHCAALAAVIRAPEVHVAHLEADLRAVGVEPAAVEPIPAIARAATELRACAADAPLALLGHDYVLEGSTNGNRFIARAVARTLGEGALRYLDPYGETQPVVWSGYRARLDGLPLDAAARATVVAGARAMFDRVAELSVELGERFGHAGPDGDATSGPPSGPR